MFCCTWCGPYVVLITLLTTSGWITLSPHWRYCNLLKNPWPYQMRSTHLQEGYPHNQLLHSLSLKTRFGLKSISYLSFSWACFQLTKGNYGRMNIIWWETNGSDTNSCNETCWGYDTWANSTQKASSCGKDCPKVLSPSHLSFPKINV